MAVLSTDLGKYLPLVATGKVREIYGLKDDKLLFVATDRISAYDVILKNGIDEKGAILTKLSKFWFDLLTSNDQYSVPDLKTHFVSLDLPSDLQQSLPPDLVSQLHGRCMVVRRLKVLPIESIVRGYITGSAWSSYQNLGTVCDIRMPTGLQESQRLEQPLWTPSTKAEIGAADENISPEKGNIPPLSCRWAPFRSSEGAIADRLEAATLIGKDLAEQIENLSIQIYTRANEYAAQRGIILADTKFEFGLDESSQPPTVVLIDEVLTPDSSRFWPAKEYQSGRSQRSFDKQCLRDWLVQSSLKGKEGVELPEKVVRDTLDKYKEAYQLLVGEPWA